MSVAVVLITYELFSAFLMKFVSNGPWCYLTFLHDIQLVAKTASITILLMDFSQVNLRYDSIIIPQLFHLKINTISSLVGLLNRNTVSYINGGMQAKGI